MKKANPKNFWHSAPGPQPQPKPEPLPERRFLPMEMTSAQAAEEWTEFFLRATDLETRRGDSLAIPAYRLRFERLKEAEISGEKAKPVELPEPYRPRTGPLAKVHAGRTEGFHLTDLPANKGARR